MMPRLLSAALLISAACGGSSTPQPVEPAPNHEGEGKERAAASQDEPVTKPAPLAAQPAPEADHLPAPTTPSEPAPEPQPTPSQPEQLTFLEVEAPPFGAMVRRSLDELAQGPAPRLKQRSVKKNEIIDDDAWFREHRVELPVFPVTRPMEARAVMTPPHIPLTAPGNRFLVQAIHQGEFHHIAIYGNHIADGDLLMIFDSVSGQVLHALDFSAFARGPKDKPGEAQFTFQGLNWAHIEGSTLFVSTSHRTYAKSSGGLNAFVSAIDLGTGDILWQSEPLVSNSANFLVRDGWIITGYGFTAEKDFLFLLDAKTGKTAKTITLKSGPSYILEKDGVLYVRTYNRDYSFAL